MIKHPRAWVILISHGLFHQSYSCHSTLTAMVCFLLPNHNLTHYRFPSFCWLPLLWAISRLRAVILSQRDKNVDTSTLAHTYTHREVFQLFNHLYH